jgi:hypothetical protein
LLAEHAVKKIVGEQKNNGLVEETNDGVPLAWRTALQYFSGLLNCVIQKKQKLPEKEEEFFKNLLTADFIPKIRKELKKCMQLKLIGNKYIHLIFYFNLEI